MEKIFTTSSRCPCQIGQADVPGWPRVPATQQLHTPTINQPYQGIGSSGVKQLLVVYHETHYQRNWKARQRLLEARWSTRPSNTADQDCNLFSALKHKLTYATTVSRKNNLHLFRSPNCLALPKFLRLYSLAALAAVPLTHF